MSVDLRGALDLLEADVVATSSLVLPDDAPVPSVPVRSTYLQYLPTPYHNEPFVDRLLQIVESILSPIEGSIDQIAYYFDPHLTPPELLPWLASWVDLDLDESWPLAKQRLLTARMATLYRLRGTRRGLREHLSIYAGLPPLIVENFSGMRLGQDAALGFNTRLGQLQRNCISVMVLAERPDELDARVLQRIIEADKPAHADYVLEVRASE